jgi:hypothetical protein
MGSNRKRWISQHGPNSNVFLHILLRKKETLFIQMVSDSVPIWNFSFALNRILHISGPFSRQLLDCSKHREERYFQV